jgi:hypothetical protein
MPWQEIMAGLIVAGAAAYVVWRLVGDRKGASGGPDVPVSRLTRKRPPADSCGDADE